MTPSDIKNKEIKLKKHSEFFVAYEENIKRLSFAINLCGYYTKISRKDEFYILEVYILTNYANVKIHPK